jgi:CRP-like cAMP-binding protein
MIQTNDAVLAPLVLSLRIRDELSNREISAVQALPTLVETFSRDDVIVREMDRLHFSCVILEGVVARTTHTETGRQLTALHIKGDWIDLHGLLLKQLDHSIVALSRCSIARVAHRDLVRISERHPHLTRLLWLSTVVDAAIHRQQVTNIGRRSPAQALVHLFCEMYIRLRTVGLANNDQFVLPLTQGDLADYLGLSLVHVSRTMRSIRKLPFVQWTNGVVDLHRFDEAAAYSEFDAGYLNLVRMPR